jgi:glycosyltransferase involved in cell wall biosynthesis
MTALCIIPCWNEENKLPKLINQIKNFDQSNYKVDFLFINNGSTDKSLKIIKESKINFLTYQTNMGIGYALINGLRIGAEKNYDTIIHLAGNGKMNPLEIDKFLDKIYKENYEFVHGSRFLKGGNYETNPLKRILLIKVFTFIINIFLSKKITDSTCGFRAFKTKLLSRNIDLFDKKEFYSYGYEYYVLGKVINLKDVSFAEIPISMNYPKTGKYSKIRVFIDWYPIIRAYFISFFDKKKLRV